MARISIFLSSHLFNIINVFRFIHSLTRWLTYQMRSFQTICKQMRENKKKNMVKRDGSKSLFENVVVICRCRRSSLFYSFIFLGSFSIFNELILSKKAHFFLNIPYYRYQPSKIYVY